MSKEDQKEEISEKENTPSNETSESEGPADEIKNDEPDPLAKLQSEYNELNDKFIRLLSEFDNFRKRTQKEKLELIKSGGSDMIKTILPVIDDFERAMIANESADNIQTLKEGFELIHSKFIHALQAKGVKEMELLGTEFNSDLSEAIANLPVEDESQKGKVIDVTEKGYFLNDTILRYAKVVVGN